MGCQVLEGAGGGTEAAEEVEAIVGDVSGSQTEGPLYVGVDGGRTAPPDGTNAMTQRGDNRVWGHVVFMVRDHGFGTGSSRVPWSSPRK